MDLSKETQASLKPKLNFFPDRNPNIETDGRTPSLRLPAINGLVANTPVSGRKERPGTSGTGRPADEPNILFLSNDEGGLAYPGTNIINNSPQPQIVILPRNQEGAGGDQYHIHFGGDGGAGGRQEGPTKGVDNALLEQLKRNHEGGTNNPETVDKEIIMEQLIKSLEQNEKISQLEEAINTQEQILSRLGNKYIIRD